MYNAVATVNVNSAENPDYVEVVDWFIKSNVLKKKKQNQS